MYPELKEAAFQRWERAHAGKTRVLVQVGHCTRAVGAEAVVEALEEALKGNPDVDLVIAGCDGACFNAPQVIITSPSGEAQHFGRVNPREVHYLVIARTDGPAVDADGVAEFFSAQHRLVLGNYGRSNPTDVDEYIVNGGYEGVHRALATSPEEVIEQVAQAGLLGRGGAYFPAARKWQSARLVDRTPRYLVVNSEEGEPGIFKDRHIMEGEPHRLLEGLIIAAYASGVEKGYIYINAEAHLSAQRVQTALDQAREYNLVGDNILGSDFSLQVEVRRGAGGYVCGEETTLLNTLEGERRAPRLRPPFPTESGLWERPTVINNTETLVNVPFILADGPQKSAFMETGLESARGTKLICLSGSVRRPGLIEVPMGTTLRQIIYDIGGGPLPGHTITAIAAGGPSSGVLPTSMLDTPIRPGMLHESGVVLGAGGIIAIDERVPIIEVVRKLAAYNAAESCGKCTPCREGTPRIVDVLDRLMAGQGSPSDLDELRYLAEVVGAASLCGLGQMAGGPINSALHFFGDELASLAGVS